MGNKDSDLSHDSDDEIVKFGEFVVTINPTKIEGLKKKFNVNCNPDMTIMDLKSVICKMNKNVPKDSFDLEWKSKLVDEKETLSATRIGDGSTIIMIPRIDPSMNKGNEGEHEPQIEERKRKEEEERKREEEVSRKKLEEAKTASNYDSDPDELSDDGLDDWFQQQLSLVGGGGEEDPPKDERDEEGDDMDGCLQQQLKGGESPPDKNNEEEGKRQRDPDEKEKRSPDPGRANESTEESEQKDLAIHKEGETKPVTNPKEEYMKWMLILDSFFHVLLWKFYPDLKPMVDKDVFEEIIHSMDTSAEYRSHMSKGGPCESLEKLKEIVSLGASEAKQFYHLWEDDDKPETIRFVQENIERINKIIIDLVQESSHEVSSKPQADTSEGKEMFRLRVVNLYAYTFIRKQEFDIFVDKCDFGNSLKLKICRSSRQKAGSSFSYEQFSICYIGKKIREEVLFLDSYPEIQNGDELYLINNRIPHIFQAKILKEMGEFYEKVAKVWKFNFKEDHDRFRLEEIAPMIKVGEERGLSQTCVDLLTLMLQKAEERREEDEERYINGKTVLLHRRGQIYSNLRNFENALSDFKESKRYSMKGEYSLGYNVDLEHNLGYSYSMTNMTKESIPHFTRSVEVNEKKDDSIYNLSLFSLCGAYFKLGKFEDCVIACSKMLERRPKEPIVRLLRIESNFVMEKWEEVESDLKNQAMYHRENKFLLKIVERSRIAMEQYKKLAKGTVALIREAIKLSSDRYFRRDAVEKLNQCVTLNPQNSWVYFLRGCVYYSLKKFTLSSEDFEKALELENQCGTPVANMRCVAGLVFRLGTCQLFHMGEDMREKGFQRIEDCVQIDEVEESLGPQRRRTLYLTRAWGYAYFPLVQNVCSALMILRAMMKLPDDNLDKHQLMEDGLQIVKTIDFGGKFTVDPTTEGGKQVIGSLMVLASLYKRMELYEEGLEILSCLEKVDPSFPDSWKFKAGLYSQMNLPKRSIEAISKYIDLIGYEKQEKNEKSDRETVYVKGKGRFEIEPWEDYISDIAMQKAAGGYFVRGVDYMKLKEYVLALLDFTKIIEMVEQSSEERGVEMTKNDDLRVFYIKTLFYRGKVYIVLEKYVEALKDIKKFHDMRPGHEAANKLLLDCFRRVRRLEEEDYENEENEGEEEKEKEEGHVEVDLDPTTASARDYFRRGKLRMKRGDHARACADFDTWVMIDPSNTLGPVVKKCLDMIKSVTSEEERSVFAPDTKYLLKRESPQEEMARLQLIKIFQIGVSMLMEDQFNVAERIFIQCINMDPGFGSPYTHLGMLEANKGKWEQAIRFFTLAIEKKARKNAKDYRTRGHCLSKLGRHDEAIPDFNQAMIINPDDVRAFYYFGNSLLAQGKVDKALLSYERALLIDPYHPLSWYAIGDLYFREKDYRESVEYFSSALSVASSDVQVDIYDLYKSRGMAYMRLGEVDNALNDFNSSIDITWRGNEDSFIQRSKIHLMKGNLEQYREDLDTANEMRNSIVSSEFLAMLQEKDKTSSQGNPTNFVLLDFLDIKIGSPDEQDSSHDQARFAFLVGQNQGELTSSHRDVQRMSKKLEKTFGYECTEMIDVTSKELINGIHGFLDQVKIFKSKKKKKVFFYFSGHGFEFNNVPYVQCFGNSEVSVKDLIFLLSSLSQCDVFVIFDCCRSRLRKEKDTSLSAQSMRTWWNVVSSCIQYKNVFMVGFSTASGTLSQAGTRLSNFTGSLLGHMKKGKSLVEMMFGAEKRIKSLNRVIRERMGQKFSQIPCLVYDTSRKECREAQL